MTDNQIDQMEQQESLLQRIEALEMNNKILRESLKSAESRFTSIIEKLPHAIVAIDRSCKIVFANQSFAEMVSFCIPTADISHKSLTGSDISQIVDKDTLQLAKNSLTHSRDIVNKDVTMGDRKVSLSLYAIKREDFTIAIFRDMYDPMIVKEEIAERIQFVIDRNMRMIQNIGSLLGEETSETTRILNSVIKSL